ncbi:MAG: dTMP kinase [Deltaproteobacteria bacterium]|nr:MAG: dTMP kinase [Deltaproteobacteria bacterium]
MGRGFFLALEGIDGSGKSTQARLLAVSLLQQGREVVLTREPSDGELGQKLRRYLQGPSRNLSPGEELDLFLADRREHVERVIKPGLAAGRIVITDRYYYSTMAYQGALGLDPGEILAANETFAPRPDLVFLLILPVSQALARLQRPRQLSELAPYLERVAAIFDILEGPQIQKVDARATSQALHTALLAATLTALGKVPSSRFQVPS